MPAASSSARPPSSALVGYGVRQTLTGRFSVVRVANHADYDLRGGVHVLRRRYTTHTGLPGILANEAAAVAKAQKLAAKDGVQFLGFRADTW